MLERKVLLVLVLCVGAIIGSNCPDDCGYHGTCGSEDECVCDSDYVGEDCSVYSKDIQEGSVYSGEVDEREWRYYALDTSSRETITWTLTLDDPETDCDLYVNEGNYPTLDTYMARNISSLPTITVTLSDVESGRYIAGVYGYPYASIDDCSYHITAVFAASPCPNDCQHRGVCNSEGVCECNSGYMGEECEVTIVTPGVEYSGYVADLFSWAYFAYIPDTVYEEIDWVVTPIDSRDHNCEMFTSVDQEPSFFRFDATKFSFDIDPITLAQTEVEEGRTYYMSVNGLFGFVACNFTASLQVHAPDSPTECPNNCSYHSTSSTCNQNECDCLPSYSGPECEEYTEIMSLDHTYEGYVGEDAWNYYHIEAETENSLIVTLHRTTNFGDVDLYVNDGGNPALYNYTYSNISSGIEMTVEILAPAGHVWYIGVFGWYAANYSLTVTESEQCPCVDSSHGSCNEDPEVCECESGYAGEDCGSVLTVLTSGQPLLNEVVGLDEWNYYVISVESASAASLTVKEHEEFGVAWVFVGFDGFPTATDYVYSDKNHHNSTHQIAYSSKEEQNGELYIGVYGSPFIPGVGGESTVEYDIVCWVSTF